MRFEEEAETLGNLHLAQAASLLGYVNGISPLEHYRMRHAGRSAVHFYARHHNDGGQRSYTWIRPICKRRAEVGPTALERKIFPIN
jgi:hypothetical protein